MEWTDLLWRRVWGEHPIADAPLTAYFQCVKHKITSQARNAKNTGAARSAASEELDQARTDFAPSADAVARRAYFMYVNEGSLPGHEVQRWLAAEAELIAERNLTRVHGFHSQT